MKYTELEQAEARIASLLDGRKARISDMENRLHELEAELEAAKAAEKNAIATGNEKAFSDARTAQRELPDAIQFAQLRLQREKEKPLMTREEGIKLMDSLMAEADAEMQELRKQILDAKLQKIEAAAFDLERRADAALLTIQRDLLKYRFSAIGEFCAAAGEKNLRPREKYQRENHPGRAIRALFGVLNGGEENGGKVSV